MASRSKVRINFGLIATMIMVICLSQSSFFKIQLGGAISTNIGIMVCIILAAILVVLLFMSPCCNAILTEICGYHLFLEISIRCILLEVFTIVMFMLKYPKFDIHSKYQKACIERNENATCLENQFSLYSLGGFSVLPAVMSWESGQNDELGFFGILLELIMEISVEIAGTNDGSNLWFMLVATLFCFVLIFMRLRKFAIENDKVRSSLKLCSAAVALVSLYLCSFTKKQFGNRELTKGVVLILFSIFLVVLIPHITYYIDILVAECRKNYLVKALVGSLLLLFVSTLMFLDKNPGFRTTETKYLTAPSCVAKEGNLGSDGNLFDLLSAGAFSVYALIISSQKLQPMDLGVFGFSLELTMYTSIKISERNPSFWLLCSFAFCVGLIPIRSYLGSLIKTNENSVGQGRDEAELEQNHILVIPAAEGVVQTTLLPDIGLVPNEHATSFNGAASENSGDGGEEIIEMESAAIEENTAIGDGEDE